MRIVMAGASGFLGRHLRRRLVADGHDVIRLVRRDPSTLEERRWRPELGELHPATLAGADAVINLAGAGVADRRWTESYKEELRSSRVVPTRTLVTAMSALPDGERPKTLLNASGVHFYGPTGDTAVDEEAPPGTGFMPELCVAWESAARQAEEVGVRVVRLRTGLVLDRSSGLLKTRSLVMNLYVGGKIGNGRQWMPWITLRDWVSAAAFLLERDDISGPVNVTGPNPSRNLDFTKALGRAMNRPAILPTPRFGVRLVMGEFGNEAIDSLRVLPAVLGRSGFTYRDSDLDEALRVALHKP
jgi:hypothetical protein